MLKNKRLKEAIENVGMVNNIDGQNFEKDFVGTAPVSYADAVIRARKRKEACKKAYEDQVKVARAALKKEVSNEEHPEPLGKIRGKRDRKMTLDEGLFESFDDEHLGHRDDQKYGNKTESRGCAKNNARRRKTVKSGTKEALTEDRGKNLCETYDSGFGTYEIKRALKKELGIDAKVSVDDDGDDCVSFEVDGKEYRVFPDLFSPYSYRLGDGFDPFRTVYSTEDAIKEVKEELEKIVNDEDSVNDEDTDNNEDTDNDEAYEALIKALDRYLDDEIEWEIEYELDTDSLSPDDTILGHAMKPIFLDKLPHETQKKLVFNPDNIDYSDMINLLEREDFKRYIDRVRTIKRRLGNSIVESQSKKKSRVRKHAIKEDVNKVSYPEYEDNEDDVCPECGKEPCECKVEESLYPAYVSYQGKKMRVQGVRPDGKYALSEPKYSGLDITNHPEYLVYVSKEDVEPLSVIVYPNGGEVTDIDLDRALSYQYGTDRDMDNSKYTDDEKQRAVNYWLKKTDGFDPYEESMKKVEQLEESKEDAKVFRVTYKHSPTVFSSVMVKAANEDEAKQKLAVKEPGKDIVGVSVMSDAEVKDMTNRGMSLMEAKIIDDFSSYEPWGAAVSTFDNIQNADKMDALEQLIDEMYPDGIDKTELNDLLAFESDWVYSMLDMPHDEDVVYDDVAVEVEDDEEE